MPMPTQIPNYHENIDLLALFSGNAGGLFDSVLDFESPENPDQVELGDKERIERLKRFLGQMKSERGKMLDLLRQCDDERILFRKLNLELIKSIVDIGTEGIVGGNKPLQAMIDRGYALNYELLKKTVGKLEGKLLGAEKSMFSQEKRIEQLGADIKMQKRKL
jgi:hypothetical protein